MKRYVLPCLLLAVLTPWAYAESKGLQEGDRIAIIGDSITEQKLYSAFIEDYLLMCKPELKLQTMQFGWGGETAGGFASRLANDMVPYKPTVATTCYGMNDGGYVALTPETLKNYTDSMDRIVTEMKKAGVRFIVVGSPGAVDTTTFNILKTKPEVYNKTLAELSKAAHDVAKKHGAVFADVYTPMMDVMAKAKAKFGNDYPIAKDGVHPGPNGHLIMAYAFLKALGCDGNIGEFTVNLKDGHATASDGHKILSAAKGTIEVESRRYPFCFLSEDLIKITEFFPFNKDLNRLTLKVTGAAGDKLKVTWGGESKVFTAKDLKAGINLAAEFTRNPFVENFKKTEEAILAQQNFETPMIKSLYHKKVAEGEADKAEKERAEARTKQQELAAAAAKTVVPVKHTIQIEPVK